VDKKEKNKNNDSEWQRGLGLFIQLSGWLVGPLVVSLFLGRWLDKRFDTRPWLFLLTTGIAFIITTIGIIKEARNFIKNIEQEAKNKANNLKSDNTSTKAK
jgi:F0F1-type ATP synthase assembly protein I